MQQTGIAIVRANTTTGLFEVVIDGLAVATYRFEADARANVRERNSELLRRNRAGKRTQTRAEAKRERQEMRGEAWGR